MSFGPIFSAPESAEYMIASPTCATNFVFPFLWLIHTARERDRDEEITGFCIMLCTVPTTQGQGQGTIVFYCVHPSPCSGPSPV